MRTRLYLELLAGVLFVLVGTIVVYGYLKDYPSFWASQHIWSVVLAIGWVIVSIGYFHQGWLVHKKGHSDDVSLLLPSVVFLVQCVLFIKGVYYDDWSLIAGALLVNSGVTVSLYQIVKKRKHILPRS